MKKVFTSLDDVVYVQQKNSEIGSGSFSSVRLVRHRNDSKKKKYAMKELKNYNSFDIRQVMKEINLHRKLDHPNIIKFEDFIEQNNKVYIFLEYAKNGDMFKFVKKKSLTEKQLLKLFYQTCQGIEYLHSNNIMHRDLKPENLLIDEQENVKICDFGWSAEFREQEIRQTICGTYEYMAPEIFFKRKQTKKTDMWSLGILLYELLHGHAPFQGQRMDQVLAQIQKKNIVFKQNININAQNLILQLLSFSPDKRPNIKQVLSSDLFKFITKKKIKSRTKRKKINPLLFSFTGKENSKNKWKKKLLPNKIQVDDQKNNFDKLKMYLIKQKDALQQNNLIKSSTFKINTLNKNNPINNINKNVANHQQSSNQKVNLNYNHSNQFLTLKQNNFDNPINVSLRQKIQQQSSLQKIKTDEKKIKKKKQQYLNLQQQIIPQTNIYSKFQKHIETSKAKKKLKSFCSQSNLLLYDYKNARKNDQMNSSFSSNQFVNYDFTKSKCYKNNNVQEMPKYQHLDSLQNIDNFQDKEKITKSIQIQKQKFQENQSNTQSINKQNLNSGKNILKFDFSQIKQAINPMYTTQNQNKFISQQNFKNIYMKNNQIQILFNF